MSELQVVVVRDEITPWLRFVDDQVSSNRFWLDALMPTMETLQRYAVGISPVVTGSYAGSHRITATNKEVILSVDPTARNTVTQTPVIRYAGAVEDRHAVYERTFGEAERMATGVLEDMVEGLGL